MQFICLFAYFFIFLGEGSILGKKDLEARIPRVLAGYTLMRGVPRGAPTSVGLPASRVH